MAPNLTEIVYDIGAQDLLVGVTDFCKFPPEAQKKEKIGGWLNPNYEKILSLKPDLVLALKFHGQAVDNLRKLKVSVLVQDCQTVEDVLNAYDVLGKALDREKAARLARQALERRLAKAKSRASLHARVSVLFVSGHNPGTLDQLYGVGSKNFVDELVTMMGGVNILADVQEPYPLISKEQLIKRDPDVIIDSIPSSEMNPREIQEEKESWKKFPELRAVRENRVFILTRDDYLIPGPTLVGLGEFLSGIFQKVQKDKVLK
jgi:iron complex transport system substrate-binding protein